MSNLIKRPGELSPKNTISMLIYGQPGIGKTSMACSSPNPVLFDSDNGIHRVNGAYQVPTVQVRSWEDVLDGIKEIAELERKGEIVCNTIIIDTVGKLLDFMSASIIAHDPKMGQRDGSLSLKGYGVRKVMFVNLIKQLGIMGKNVVFVAHDREEKQGEQTFKRPEIGGSSANDLVRELDLVGYMFAYGNDRIVSFDPGEYYFAKNACNLEANMKVPVIVDRTTGEALGNNDFLTNVIKSYENWQIRTRQKTAEYNRLIDDIKSSIESASTVDELNKLCAALGQKESIYNSRLKAAQMLNSRASAINCTFDKLNKKYVSNG